MLWWRRYWLTSPAISYDWFYFMRRARQKCEQNFIAVAIHCWYGDEVYHWPCAASHINIRRWFTTDGKNLQADGCRNATALAVIATVPHGDIRVVPLPWWRSKGAKHLWWCRWANWSLKTSTPRRNRHIIKSGNNHHNLAAQRKVCCRRHVFTRKFRWMKARKTTEVAYKASNTRAKMKALLERADMHHHPYFDCRTVWSAQT